MEQGINSTCQCEDDLHHGEACGHPASSFQMTGGEPVSVCACCAHHQHMTTQRTPVPDAEKEKCAAR